MSRDKGQVKWRGRTAAIDELVCGQLREVTAVLSLDVLDVLRVLCFDVADPERADDDWSRWRVCK